MLSPSRYANAAVLAEAVGLDMLDRLQWMLIKPKVVLDIGCGVGKMSALLQERYQEAHMLALDRQLPMLQYAKEMQPLSRIAYLCAQACALPLSKQTVDLVYANLLLPWQAQETYLPLFNECRRVLRPDGLMLLSAFGPRTLQEWRPYVKAEAMPTLISGDALGEALLSAGMIEPVIEVLTYTLTYREREKLCAEICASGMLFITDSIAFSAHLPAPCHEQWELTFEVIHAHAFVAHQQTKETDSSLTKIPLAYLREQIAQKKI